MKTLWVLGTLLVICIITLAVLINSCNRQVTEDLKEISTKYKEIDSLMKSNLGCKVVLSKDTMIITDYSVVNNNYTVNGQFKINSELLDKIKIN